MSTTTEAMVQRRGRVFRFGEHVDAKGRKFSLTPIEFALAHPEGVEVPIGFDPVGRGHYGEVNGKPHAFEGKLGTASNFAAAGEFLDADFTLHPLLDDAIRDEGLKMSAIFGRTDKKIRRIDVTDRPIVADAAFFADADPDEVAIFADLMAFKPEVASSPEESGEEGDDDELTKEELAQHMHEILAAEHPDLCRGDDDSGFARSKIPQGMRGHLAQMHDFTIHHGATCPGMGHASFAEEDEDVDEETEVTEATETAAFSDDRAALLARIDALEKTNRRQRDERLAADAAAFARDHADRLAPPAQPLFVGLYQALASQDDDRDDTVSFAYGKDQKFSGSRVDLLRRAVESLRPHGLGTEKALNRRVTAPPARDDLIAFAHEDDDPAVLSDARKAELDRLNKANQAY